MSAWRRARLLLALAILAGCASAPPEHEQGVQQIRDFAEAIARAYGVPRIPVLVGPSTFGGFYRGGFFTVNASLLDSPHRDAVVAHEMAHYLLGHDNEPLRVQEAEQLELDSNAKGVEIFVRARGWSEEQGIRAMYGVLLSIHRAVERGAFVFPGHLPPCQEIADLLGRFPRHAPWTGALECAPPAITTRVALPVRTKTYEFPGRLLPDLEPLLYAYITDSRPSQAGGRFRERTEFFVDGDRTLMLGVVLKNDGRKHRLQSSWSDSKGVLRRTVESFIDLSTKEGYSTWTAHGDDISSIWLYPGRWTVRLRWNRIDAGAYDFDLVPGAGQ